LTSIQRCGCRQEVSMSVSRAIASRGKLLCNIGARAALRLIINIDCRRLSISYVKMYSSFWPSTSISFPSVFVFDCDCETKKCTHVMVRGSKRWRRRRIRRHARLQLSTAHAAVPTRKYAANIRFESSRDGMYMRFNYRCCGTHMYIAAHSGECPDGKLMCARSKMIPTLTSRSSASAHGIAASCCFGSHNVGKSERRSLDWQPRG
jgi:hypothetical protein